MSTATTHIKTKKQLVPELRFKEFEGEWCKDKLGAISKITTGSTPSTSVNEFYNGNCLFVSPADMQGNRYIKNTKTTLTEAGFDKCRKLKKGSVLFVCIGSTIGKVAQSIGECSTNQQINALEAKENFSNDFIYSLLEKNGQKIKLLAGVQAVPQINKTDFSNFKYLFPTLPEQQKIASFLSAVDEKIQQLNKKKALLEQFKKGVMHKLFSRQLRFKDQNGNLYPDWEEKRLGEIATKESSNISANTIEENFGEFKIYGASGLLKKIDFFREEKPFVSIVKDGAGVGRTLLCDGNSSVLGTLDIIKPKVKVVLYFLYSVLNNVRFEKYIVGSTIPHIYFKDYSSERITIPCYEEQQKIATYLSSIDTKIENVNNQITQTQTFKKGLLQQMFV